MPVACTDYPAYSSQVGPTHKLEAFGNLDALYKPDVHAVCTMQALNQLT